MIYYDRLSHGRHLMMAGNIAFTACNDRNDWTVRNDCCCCCCSCVISIV